MRRRIFGGKKNKDIKVAIDEYDKFVESCGQDHKPQGDRLIDRYYEHNSRQMGLPPNIVEALKKFGVIYPALHLYTSTDGIAEDSIIQNFYLYQRFYSQIRRQWEGVANRGTAADQEEFRSIFGHFRSDQDFLRIMGYNEKRLEGISHEPEIHFSQYKAIRKKIKDLRIGNKGDRKFNPEFWNKVFTRFQYGANGLKLEGGKSYAVAVHNNVDAIKIMLGDNSQYRGSGKHESCTPIYSAGAISGLAERSHAPFLYSTYNKKGETLGVVYNQESIDVVSGDTQAMGSFGREPAMILKSDVVHTTKDSAKAGELRDGRTFLTDITKYDTAAKKMVPGFGNSLGTSDAIELAVSNAWRRANLTPYLDPRNMSSGLYKRRLGFNQRHPDATNRGRGLYKGQDKYAELLISHKGSMRNSVDGIFIDITGVSNNKIKAQKLYDIFSLMATYPFLKFYIYDRNNSLGHVMKSYSSLVARKALGELSYDREHCDLSYLLRLLDSSAQEEVNKKAEIMILLIKEGKAERLLSDIEVEWSHGNYRLTDKGGLELFSPFATSKIESDIEKSFNISRAVFLESRFQRMQSRFEKGKEIIARYGDASLSPVAKFDEMRDWILGFLTSCCIVMSDDRDQHRQIIVAIENMNFEAKELGDLYECMGVLLSSFDRIFVGRSHERLQDNLLKMSKESVYLIETFDKKPIIEIFNDIFPDEYNPESSFSTQICDFIQRSELESSGLQRIFEGNTTIIDSYINAASYAEFTRDTRRVVADVGADNDQVADLLERLCDKAVDNVKKPFIGIVNEARGALEATDAKGVVGILRGFIGQIRTSFPVIYEPHKEAYEELRHLELTETSSKEVLLRFFNKKIEELVGIFNSKAVLNFMDDLVREIANVERADIIGVAGIDRPIEALLPESSVEAGAQDAMSAASGGAPIGGSTHEVWTIPFGINSSAAESQSGGEDLAIDRLVNEITEILKESPIETKNEPVELYQSTGNSFLITKTAQGIYEVEIAGFNFHLQRGGSTSPFQVQSDNPDDMRQLNQYLSVIGDGSNMGSSQKGGASAPPPPVPERPIEGPQGAATSKDPRLLLTPDDMRIAREISKIATATTAPPSSSSGVVAATDDTNPFASDMPAASAIPPPIPSRLAIGLSSLGAEGKDTNPFASDMPAARSVAPGTQPPTEEPPVSERVFKEDKASVVRATESVLQESGSSSRSKKEPPPVKPKPSKAFIGVAKHAVGLIAQKEKRAGGKRKLPATPTSETKPGKEELAEVAAPDVIPRVRQGSGKAKGRGRKLPDLPTSSL